MTDPTMTMDPATLLDRYWHVAGGDLALRFVAVSPAQRERVAAKCCW